MNSCFLYAKLKRKPNLKRVLSSDSPIYEIPEFNGVAYSPATLIEDEEHYKISQFSTTDFTIPFLNESLDSVNFEQISRGELKDVSFICTVQQDLLFFQNINSKQYITKKWFRIDEHSIVENAPIVTINPYADAIYDRNSDSLYFLKLPTANRIFKGMDQLYREATEEETETFLLRPFLKVSTGYNKDNVSVPNRKRIAMVNGSFDQLNDSEKESILNYITGYCSVVYDNGQFDINNDDDLKFVLWGIEQRFYTTLVGLEKRVANSVIKL